MIIVQPSFEIETPEDYIAGMLKRIEKIGRVCYKSEEKMNAASADEFVRKLIASEHEAVIEHEHITVRFICDRGVSHELVRHRLASYCQESTRYCNYSTTKNKDIRLIHPRGLTDEQRSRREAHYWNVQHLYEQEISEGLAPQIARGILPTSLKTEIVMTCNLREWRHVTKLRGSTKAHPQMREIILPLQCRLHTLLPRIFNPVIRNLCDDCKKEFPTCNGANIVWGIDCDESLKNTKAGDSVVHCSNFEPNN